MAESSRFICTTFTSFNPCGLHVFFPLICARIHLFRTNLKKTMRWHNFLAVLSSYYIMEWKREKWDMVKSKAQEQISQIIQTHTTCNSISWINLLKGIWYFSLHLFMFNFVSFHLSQFLPYRFNRFISAYSFAKLLAFHWFHSVLFMQYAEIFSKFMNLRFCWMITLCIDEHFWESFRCLQWSFNCCF